MSKKYLSVDMQENMIIDLVKKKIVIAVVTNSPLDLHCRKLVEVKKLAFEPYCNPYKFIHMETYYKLGALSG